MSTGKLNIVATPIGNLKDVTLRALETLKGADFILCEDTRVTKKLLDAHKISRPTISYHQHSDAKKIKEIRELLQNGKNLALVTDAGTPGISDPGNLLIHDLLKLGVDIIPIPGACAAITALSASGFPTDKFVFMGFPPHKNKRQKYFKEVAGAEYTVVFYESGHRIIKALQDLKNVLSPGQEIVVARELTKMFETFYRGTIEKVAEAMKDTRGEFVVIVSK
jgi:16S rRNA (cytidine1402-2'-O)-methyltransferase